MTFSAGPSTMDSGAAGSAAAGGPLTAEITDIQHFSVGDGPGIRTTVFFKGCNLHCFWCHNPETVSGERQLLFFSALCRKCGRCAAACPAGAAVFRENGPEILRSRCNACGRCAAVCPGKALSVAGRTVSLGEVWSEIREDAAFYRNSGGGVTLSGGEPLLQPAFVKALAALCRENGISVILDTAGHVPAECFDGLLPFISEFYFDIKAPDEESYRVFTGGSLALALRNLRYLLLREAAVTVRIPVIPGVNDTEEASRQIAQALRETGAKTVSLLPFHRYGEGKYRALGLPDPYGDRTPVASEKIENLKKIYKAYFDIL